MFRLKQEDYHKAAGLVKSRNELSVFSVISGIMPGIIYANDEDNPTAALVITSECNYLSGTTSDDEFNSKIKDIAEVGFWDPLTPDTDEWAEIIPGLHRNRFVRKYTRRNYILSKDDYRVQQAAIPEGFALEKAMPCDLREKRYANSDRLLDIISGWGTEDNYMKYGGIWYLRRGNTIVSWSMVDCYHEDKAEIGVYTDAAYRKMGLGRAVVAANINDCFERGIRSIAWHCTDINKGSIAIAEKMGFTLLNKYVSFASYPPVENFHDLSEAEWNEWGEYFENVSGYEPELLPEQLYAYVKANNVGKTIKTVQAMMEAGKDVRYHHLSARDGFLRLLDSIRYFRSIGMCSNFTGIEWDEFAEKLIR